MKSLITFLFILASEVGALSQKAGPALTSPDLWKLENVPFSFKYGSKESAQLLTTWPCLHQPSPQYFASCPPMRMEGLI